MSNDVPFDKTFDLTPDQPKEVAPLVRAVAANNPSPFTFKGTVSYIIGHGKVAILDPGPDDDAHVAALLDAVRGETVTHIFVTHTHRDHSPAVPKVKAATGATVYAQGPHRLARPIHVGDDMKRVAQLDRHWHLRLQNSQAQRVFTPSAASTAARCARAPASTAA